MAAATGATGARTWLQVYAPHWLTPKRLRSLTIALFAAALLVSTIGLGGSSTSVHRAVHPVPGRVTR